MIIEEIHVPARKFIVAVSGGIDSLSLAFLAAEAAKKSGIEMVAVFVDHHLRRESSSEIVPFVTLLQQRGIKTHVLHWEHEAILGNVEKKAREARYDLLSEFCRKIGAEFILVAHHALDQWETFFMRLSRGSGLTGLCAMHEVSEYKSLKISRPLLMYSKADLWETLSKKFGIREYVQDPMNCEPKYERVKWRQGYHRFSSEFGLDIESVGTSISRLQRAEDCLEMLAKRCKSEVLVGNHINLPLFKTYHIELQTRVLRKIIEDVTASPSRIISYSLLEATVKKIIANNFVATNIAHCLFRKDKTKNIKVSVELRK